MSDMDLQLSEEAAYDEGKEIGREIELDSLEEFIGKLATALKSYNVHVADFAKRELLDYIKSRRETLKGG